MNKNIFLSIIGFVSVFSFVEGFGFTFEDIGTHISELPYKRSLQAQAAAFVFIKDKELAARYIKNGQFYARKSKVIFGRDNFIDLVVYPAVDISVGHGMNKLNEFEFVRGTLTNISPRNKKFLLNNVQLITAAGVTKLISIEAGKGLDNMNKYDVKSFGKSCAAQVGCDAADEYVVKPMVKMLVEDENSWTATGLRFAGNYVLAQYVVSRVASI